jgi:hypothetical protein
VFDDEGQATGPISHYQADQWEKKGYKVFQAASPAEANEMYRKALFSRA